MIAPLLKSVLVLAVISTCIASLFANNIWTFLKAFTITTLLQVIAYNIYRQVVQLFAEKLMNDRISEFTKQGVELTCPCSRAVKNLIPIQLNADNSYKCLDCSKNVMVNVEVRTFLETQPLDLEKTSAALNTVYAAVTNEQQDGPQI